MPWIYYGDDSYCSCPHCESEEEDGMKYLPHEPSATRYDWENQSATPGEPEYRFRPLPGEPLFYRLSTDSIGTPLLHCTSGLQTIPTPLNLKRLPVTTTPRKPG